MNRVTDFKLTLKALIFIRETKMRDFTFEKQRF